VKVSKLSISTPSKPLSAQPESSGPSASRIISRCGAVDGSSTYSSGQPGSVTGAPPASRSTAGP
jgi:hypothetical protein